MTTRFLHLESGKLQTRDVISKVFGLRKIIVVIVSLTVPLAVSMAMNYRCYFANEIRSLRYIEYSECNRIWKYDAKTQEVCKPPTLRFKNQTRSVTILGNWFTSYSRNDFPKLNRGG